MALGVYLLILTGIVIYVISRLNSMTAPTERFSEGSGSANEPEKIYPPEMLYFYSDSCPHARNMMPAWDSAAESLRGKVRAVKVSPESPRFREFMKFHKGATPTVLYVPNRDSTPVIYQGDRSAESLIAFAEANSPTGIFYDPYNN